MSNAAKVTWGLIAAGVILLVFLFNSLFGINNSGQRQFVQTVTGTTKVVFKEGPYAKWLGTNHEYSDYLTYDFTGPNGRCEFEQNDGIKVQYQDGGYGVICGQIRFPLPTDPQSMIDLHKAYRSEEGVRVKLVDKTTRDISTITASLITSTEAYTTKRAEVQRLFQEQFRKGTLKTDTEIRKVVIAVDEKGKEEVQDQEVPVVMTKDGQPQYNKNKLEQYGINNVDVNITGFDFEDKTLAQISARRDATNRAMTAKDLAKAAYWEKEQKEAEGEKAVAEAKYREMEKAQVEIQAAERDKELAIIEATKQKEQAIELTDAAEEEEKRQRALAKAAVEESKKIKTLADAEAYRLREVQEAGELKLRLDNELAIAKAYADGMKGMQVPSTMIVGAGSAGSKGASEMETLLQFQVLESARKAAATKANVQVK